MGNTPVKSSKRHSTSTGYNTKNIQLGGPGPPAPPGQPVLLPGSFEDPQPDIVGIRWERSPNNGGSAIIGYLVEHRRLGSSYWVRSSPNLCPFPELTLSGLEPGWRYQFRVRAQNNFGLSYPSELSDPLTVTLQRSAATAPRFDLELKDTIVLENEQAEFIVKLSGTPMPKISWFKDGFEIFSSRRTRIVTESGKSTLLIHQTALNDEGEIKCTATNRAGHVSSRSKLFLQAYPRIRLPRQYEDGLLFEQDETIKLKVSVAGKPPPSVIWYHDGEIINYDERHIIEALDSGECSMKIPSAKRSDRGEYTVKALNQLGDDIVSFLVTVTDRPATPGKAMIAMTLGRSVSLSWKEPEDDGGCKIGTYIIEYYRVGWNVWLKAATCRQPTITLSELIEGSEYKFRVKAENPYGVSDPSDESDVIFIPDPKRGINTPPLPPDKSQSQREIFRGRSKERHFNTEKTKRTRSLTREEANRNISNDEFDVPSRSVSAHRLITAPIKPPRADSRVTFADTVFLHVEKPLEDNSPPIPPVRPRSKRDKHENNANLYNEDQDYRKRANIMEKSSSTISTTNKQSYFEDSIINKQQIHRDKQTSSMPIIENLQPTFVVNQPRIFHEKQTFSSPTIYDPQPTSYESKSIKSSLLLPREENAEDVDLEFRGSSEFMLVLYPDQKNGKKNVLLRSASEGEAEEEKENNDEDLVPPPMSLSLPELFSANHQIIEIMREAVSSTELLHERAMERFYKAVAVEEAEAAKKHDTSIINKEQGVDILAGKLRNRKIKKLPASSPSAIQIKLNRRRSSESQASPHTSKSIHAALTLPVPQLIASDPNLHFDPNLKDSDQVPATELVTGSLHRWDDKAINLAESISEEVSENEESLKKSKTDEYYRDVKTPDRELGNMFVITDDYTESTDEGSGSEETDSEDLRTLKSRLLAQPAIEEETYHPFGQVKVSTYSSFESDDIAFVDNSYPSPRVTTLPTNSTPTIQPKSILKKRSNDELNSISDTERAILSTIKPPSDDEKNIQNSDEIEITAKPSSQSTLMSESIPDQYAPTITSQIDQDNTSILNAAEAAKNRRKPVTPKPELEKKSSTEEREDFEARMAVVDHYTEIVKEYAASHQTFPPNRFSRSNTPESHGRISRSSTPESRRRFYVNQNEPENLPVTHIPYRIDQTHVVEKEEVQSRKNSVSSPVIKPILKDDAKKSNKKLISNESPVTSVQNTSVESTRGRSSVTPARTLRRDVSQDRDETGSFNRMGRKRDNFDAKNISASKSISKKIISIEDKIIKPHTRERVLRPSNVIPSDDQQSESNFYHQRGRSSSKTLDSVSHQGRNATDTDGISQRLIAKANINVKSTMSYIVDVIILIGAVYVYLFKKEVLAIPLIGLLLYRRIIDDINAWIPSWLWKGEPRKD